MRLFLGSAAELRFEALPWF